MKRWRQIWRHFPKRHRRKTEIFLGELRVENRERHDYREFLRKFSVFREELKADPDTFDYGFYSYGMSLYGNMPLIEPLETREEHRIEEFAVVIDNFHVLFRRADPEVF